MLSHTRVYSNRSYDHRGQRFKGTHWNPSLVVDGNRGVPTAYPGSLSCFPFPALVNARKCLVPPSSTGLKSDYTRTISPPSSLHSPTKRPFAVRRALFWDRCVSAEGVGRRRTCRGRNGGIAKEKREGTRVRTVQVLERRIRNLFLEFSFDFLSHERVC